MDIAAGLTAVSAALTTARQIGEIDKLNATADLKLKLASLQSDLADVKIALSDAKEALSDKDQTINELRATRHLRETYRMAEASPGVLVYASTSTAEPAHWACIPCFDRGIRSILQNRGNISAGRREDYNTWDCPACKTNLRVYYTKKPAINPGVILDD